VKVTPIDYGMVEQSSIIQEPPVKGTMNAFQVTGQGNSIPFRERRCCGCRVLSWIICFSVLSCIAIALGVGLGVGLRVAVGNLLGSLSSFVDFA